jgi:hypothetical protein
VCSFAPSLGPPTRSKLLSELISNFLTVSRTCPARLRAMLTPQIHSSRPISDRFVACSPTRKLLSPRSSHPSSLPHPSPTQSTRCQWPPRPPPSTLSPARSPSPAFPPSCTRSSRGCVAIRTVGTKPERRCSLELVILRSQGRALRNGTAEA